MYLEIIKIVTIKLFLESKNIESFIELFSNPKIINEIDKIFNKDIKNSLEKLYENYKYFEEGTLK